MFGGERVDEAGQPVMEAAEDAFARGHYEQHMRGSGHVVVGDERYELRGLGLRDHSWGPRYWQNLRWYRWLPMSFTDDFALNLSVIQMRDGRRHVWGMVLRREGEADAFYDPVVEGRVESEYDAQRQATGQRIWVRTAGGHEVDVIGRAITRIPLRNRRRRDDGEWLVTRITEAMTRYECAGRVGYGMAEYLDQMDGDRPAGFPE